MPKKSKSPKPHKAAKAPKAKPDDSLHEGYHPDGVHRHTPFGGQDEPDLAHDFQTELEAEVRRIIIANPHILVRKFPTDESKLAFVEEHGHK